MATETSRSSSSSADSYIGSLISLTSKSEIRYEGILYNINTEESSIGLSNVRSFGTEGRKKDGPQLMPSDKVYEYILFRGSDIKDLQVKSSKPVRPTQPINSDPAIIQSHYPSPAPTPSSSSTTNSLPGPSTHNPHLGQPGSTFQNGPPLYPPGGNLGSWTPSPSPPNPSGPTMPMYWPGFYTPPNGLAVPPSLPPQPMQYPSFSTSTQTLPEYPSPLLPISTSSANLNPNSLVLATESLPNLMHNNASNLFSGPKFPYEGTSQSQPVISSEPPTPILVTPGQLLPPGPAAISSSQSSESVHKHVEAVQVRPASSSLAPSVPVSVPPEAQPAILPLPSQTHVSQRPNGATYPNRHSYSYRGRERGRGSGISQPVMKFTEEFDFNAMNEKFNKDEVWGTLGKTNKSSSKEKDGNTSDDELEDENYPNLPKIDVKPVYSKDDFFDTLSCNSFDHQSNNGRVRFSEQRKLDTETFGEFSRYRGGGRGGRGPYRGGRFHGGGHYGRGYGYFGRGRGVRNLNPMGDY